MYIDPSRPNAMSVGLLNGSPLCSGAGSLGVPRVISSSPVAVHFRTVWSPLSVVHIESSAPISK